ncbi:MAG: hypothetical protein FWD01_04470 [Defluviitaleaceae bacterium]|nr:hypothetical protein [Defluviitaleaceae bacterium]
MEGAISSAIRGFNIRCNKILRDKFGFICITNTGTRRLARAFGGIPDILFCHGVKEYLFNCGITEIDRYYLSIQNAPYFAVGEDIYMLTDFFEESENIFHDNDMFLNALSQIGKIHANLRGLEIKPKNIRPSLGEDSEKTLERLKAIRRKLMKAGKFSDFDMLFLEGMDFFAEFIEEWNKISKESEIIKIKEIGQSRFICHNLLKEENMFIESEKFYITNFIASSYCHYIYDLAYIIKRYFLSRALAIEAEKPLNMEKILEIYNIQNPINDIEIKFLRILLLFPDKFIKISDSYYCKKRVFVPKTFSLRMEDIIRTKEIIRCLLLN